MQNTKLMGNRQVLCTLRAVYVQFMHLKLLNKLHFSNKH